MEICVITGLARKTAAFRRVREGGGWWQELFGTIAQCLNLEQEIHHNGSKLCILGFELLK